VTGQTLRMSTRWSSGKTPGSSKDPARTARSCGGDLAGPLRSRPLGHPESSVGPHFPLCAILARIGNPHSMTTQSIHDPLKPGAPLLSPLRYPGSKRKLIPYLKAVLEANQVEPSLLVEPFAGGASVSLQLAADDPGLTIALSDADPLVAAFWKCVFFDTKWLVDAIDSLKISLASWDRYKSSHPRSTRDRALKCLFLNRTSFSGIIATTGGPLGGRSRSSQYPIACRFPKITIIKRILQASTLADRVAFVRACDWAESLAMLPTLTPASRPGRVFVYLDPPFYAKAERLYNVFFAHADHVRLSRALSRLRYPWLLSYDPAPAIVCLYQNNGSAPKRIDMLYSLVSSSRKSRPQELIVTNLRRLPSQSNLPRSGEPSRIAHNRRP